MSKVTLTIPDAHVNPGQDLSRFIRAGRLIEDRRPDTIVILGDFLTLESLSYWDKDRPLKMERRRYKKDIHAGLEALDLLFYPLQGLQARQRRNKEKLYRPRIIYCEGNHEDRLPLFLDKNPQLAGHMDLVTDLRLREYGVTDFVPYREFAEEEGVLFTHAVMNGRNKPFQGKYAVHRSLEASSKSVVFGHLHRKEGVNLKRHGGGELIRGLTCGAFFEEVPDYAKGSPSAYWLGLMLLKHLDHGMYDEEEISMERLRHEYSV